MGDFNMTPSSLAHAIITTTGLVNDSWMTMYPSTPLKDHDPTRSAHYNLTTLGVTCDSVLNSWRIKDPVIPPPETADPRGQRLDYIFHSETTSHITAAKVGFTEPFKLPSGQIVSLSDHFSIEVTLVVKPAPHFPLLPAAAAGIKPQNEAQELLVEVAEDSHDLKPFAPNTPATNEEVKSFYHPSPRYLPLDLIAEIQSLIKMYTAREVQQSFWRIAHFWGSVVVLVALHVACWFWRTGGFLWVFLSWVVAVSGTLDGLIGWVFMKGELSALKEFEEEVERYKSVVIGEQGGNNMINGSRNGSTSASNGRRVY
jgi:sphingomyelin phosphodiesterase 2